MRRLAYEAADCGLLGSDLAAGIRRVKGVKKPGVRPGNWLTAEQAHSLRQAPDSQGIKGKRDRALLALLLACGLRRHEAVGLRIDDFQQREEHWAIVDLLGKAGHVRTVPIPDCVKGQLDEWLRALELPGQDLSQGHPDMARLHDGKVDLAHREGLREQDRYAQTGPS